MEWQRIPAALVRHEASAHQTTDMKHLPLFLVMTSTAMAQVPSALPWQPLGGGTNGAVDVLLPLDNGHLLVAGQFTNAGGSTQYKVAEWDGASFAPYGPGLPMTAVNLCAVEYNGELWIGGGFGGIGFDDKELARWNGTNWTFMDVFNGVFTSTRALIVHEGELYAAGDDNNEIGGFVVATHHVVKRWNGTTWDMVGSGFNEGVIALASHGGSLVAGGAFTASDSTGTPLSHVARFDTIANEWSELAGGLNAHVRALHAWNGSLYAGGELYDTTVTFGLARLEEGGAAWDHLLPGLAGYMQAGTDAAYVRGIAHTSDRLLLCGELDFLSTPFTGSGAGTWNGTLDGASAIAVPNASIDAIAWWNGALIIGGAFTQVGADSIPHVATVPAITLGVDAAVAAAYPVLWPVPADRQVSLDMGPITTAPHVEILDALGRRVQAPVVKSNNILTVDVSGLASGCYEVLIKADRTSTNRIIVQH